jgi:LysM repeat protein
VYNDETPLSHLDPEARRSIRRRFSSGGRLRSSLVGGIQRAEHWIPHLAFLAVVSLTLLLGRAILCGAALRESEAATAPTVPVTPNTSVLAQGQELLGGTGGEVADLLVGAVVPHTTIPRRYRIDPITYTVQTGDNVSSIAEQFGVSVETILWNNGSLEDNPDYLGLGDVLTVLPVSGVYHTVVKGDTLETIAQQYKVIVEDIVRYEGNYMTESFIVTVGQKLIVPGGRKPYQVRHVVAWSGEIPKDAKRGTGVFGWPISGYITQRYYEYHTAGTWVRHKALP